MKYYRKRIRKADTQSSSAGGSQMQDGSSTTQYASLLLFREDVVCQLPAKLAQGPDLVGWADRDREAVWLVGAGRRLGLEADSVTAAVAILDQVICRSRVSPKYINCVAAGCLHIAKKLYEDREETTTNFLRRLHLEYSASEMKRMEMRILCLLDWDAQLPTLSRFLDVMLQPIGATYLISPLRYLVESIVCCSHLMAQFRPSVIAFSVVSLVLEATRRHWLQASHHLVTLFKIDFGELIRCRERVALLWERCITPSFSPFGLLSNNNDSMSQDEMDDEDGEQLQSTEYARSCATSPLMDMKSPPTLQPTPC